MLEQQSFGYWLRLKRKALDLTREALADRVGCSVSMIRKLEDEERHPSAQIAELLAEIFKIPTTERTAFLRFARGDWASAPSGVIEGAPWRVSTTPRSNLPAPLTSLIGREGELAQLREYLADPGTRLVTLIGPPGNGKTRLGVEVAQTVLSEFSDGVFLIALAPLDDPDLVAPTILQLLGFVETKGRLPLERLKEGIGEKQMLLVLDNVEHLIERIATLASELLLACSRLKILATSREALRVPGEWLYLVPMLSIPTTTQLASMEVEMASQFAALTLFAERARAMKPDFALTADNIAAVAAICVQLDGLPLAIELIAARIRLMSPQVLFERLSAKYTLYADGMRAASVRQKTLHNAVAWSYNLLSSEERELFAYLSVFAGGFTLDAAESIFPRTSTTTTVFDIIASLLDKSLLQRMLDKRGEPRFSMLVTIQQFAAERLSESGETEKGMERHRDWFLNVAQGSFPESLLWGAVESDVLDRLETARDNLRAALAWSMRNGQVEERLRLAGLLVWFWYVRSQFSEGRYWLEQALAKSEGASALARVHVLHGLGVMAMQQGDLGNALGWFSQALALGRELKHFYAGWDLMHLGQIAAQQDDYDRATALFAEALNLFEELGFPIFRSSVLLYWGIAACHHRDYDRARMLVEESLPSLWKADDKLAVARALHILGVVARHQGDNWKSTSLFKESLTLSQELGARLEVAQCLEGLASVASTQSSAEKAVRLFASATALRQIIGTPLLPGDHTDFDRDIGSLHTRLNEATFNSAWSAGLAMSPEQAIALALEE